MLRLREPRTNEFEMLSDLCMRSKAVWGYDEKFMQACRAELTLAPGDMHTSRIRVADADGVVVGVAQVSATDGIACLEKLFVEPSRLRTGAGRELFAWARRVAHELGAATLVIDADPGAAGFYRRMGARDAGVAPSESIPGRFLPRFVLDLA